MNPSQNFFANNSDLFSSLDDCEEDFLDYSDAPEGLFKTQRAQVDDSLPSIVLLHGITDCHLKNTLDRDNRIWLDYIDLVRGRFSRLLTLQPDGMSDQPGTRFETDGPLWKKYRTAIRHWQENRFDANIFCYDWRKSVVAASVDLDRYLNSHEAVRRGKKIILVCHSMGGVVASHWAATQPRWAQLIERCVFVGSPLGGSYSAAQAILGLSPSFRKMALLSIRESMKDFQIMAASFPGLVDLLPNPDIFPEAADFYQRAGWPGSIYPQTTLLDQSRSIKKIVWESPLFEKSIHLIATGLPTLAEMPWNQNRNERLDTQLCDAGDGAVLNKSSTAPGLDSFLVSGEHSMLLNEPAVYETVLAIAKGDAISLPKVPRDGRLVSYCATQQPLVVGMKPPSPMDEKVQHAIERYASDDTRDAMLGFRTLSTQHSFSRGELLQPDFSWQNSFSLALASELAYQVDVEAMKVTATGEWGFTFAEPFDEKDTEGVVLSDDNVVVLAFRGTEMNVRDWIGNLKVLATNSPVGRIHSGFWQAYQDAESAVLALLRQFDASHKKLWICGHSLGGALAVIAGARLYSQYEIHGVYTYGQPKLHVNKIAETYRSHLPNRYVRIVNNNDAVPKVPPGYMHFGQLQWFNSQGDLRGLRTLSTDGLPDGLVVPMETPEELSESEFNELQKEIQMELVAEEAALAAPDGLLLPRRGLADSRFGISFSEHSLSNAYIPAIEKQF